MEQDVRFSDAELAGLKAMMMQHVEDEKSWRDEHCAWRKEQDGRWQAIGDQLESLVAATASNAKAVADLIGETRDIVQLHKDFQGAARVGSAAQRAVLCVAKWGAIGAGAAAILQKMLGWPPG